MIRKILTSGNGDNNKGNSRDDIDKKRVAACVLLLEAAHMDEDFRQDEMDHIVETLKTKFGLSDAYAHELVALSGRERENAVDLWQFTNHINRNCSEEDKLAIMEDVWRIILVDGRLEEREDYFAHKMANLLRLTHKQLIDAKLNAREQLS